MVNLIQILAAIVVVLFVALYHDLGHLKSILLFYEGTFAFWGLADFGFLIFMNVFNSINFFRLFDDDF